MCFSWEAFSMPMQILVFVFAIDNKPDFTLFYTETLVDFYSNRKESTILHVWDKLELSRSQWNSKILPDKPNSHPRITNFQKYRVTAKITHFILTNTWFHRIISNFNNIFDSWQKQFWKWTPNFNMKKIYANKEEKNGLWEAFSIPKKFLVLVFADDNTQEFYLLYMQTTVEFINSPERKHNFSSLRQHGTKQISPCSICVQLLIISLESTLILQKHSLICFGRGRKQPETESRTRLWPVSN